MALLSDKKNVTFGIILTYISLAISILGSLFVTPVVLNNIGDSNYGLLSFCNSLTSWLSLISSSLGASYIYFATKDKRENGDEKKTNTIFQKIFVIIAFVIAIVVTLLLFIFWITGFQLSNYTKEQNNLIFVLLLISTLQVIVSIVFYVFSLNNQYTKSFVFSKGLSILISISSYAANVLIAIFTKSIILVAVIGVASVFLNGLVNMIFAIKARKMQFKKLKLNNYKSDFFSMFKYSSIILVSTIIANLDSNLDKTLLGLMVDSQSVTLYQLSISFSSHLIVAAYAFTEVTRPQLYALYRDGRKEEANNLFIKITKIQSIIVLLLIFGYFACGFHFNVLWLGKERIDVFYYSSVLFLCQIVPVTKSLSTDVYRANNLHKIPTFLSFLSIVINLALSIGLILLLDKKMAVWACIIGTFVPRFLFTWIIGPVVETRVIQTPIKRYYLNLLKNMLLAVIACAPSVFLCIWLESVNMQTIFKILIEGSLFVALYAIEMFIFERKAIKDYFLKYMKRKKISTDGVSNG